MIIEYNVNPSAAARAAAEALAERDTRLIDYSLQVLAIEHQRLSSLYMHVGILIPVTVALGAAVYSLFDTSLLSRLPYHWAALGALVCSTISIVSLLASIAYLYLAGVPRGSYETVSIDDIAQRLIDEEKYGDFGHELYWKGLVRVQELVSSAVRVAHGQTEIRYNALRKAIMWVLVAAIMAGGLAFFRIFLV